MSPNDETAPTAKEKSSRVAGGSSKPKPAPNRKPPQNRNAPTTDGRTKPNPKSRQIPAVPRINQGGTQTSSRGRGKFSSKGSRSGPSEDPNVASWRDHFDHGKVFQFGGQSSNANGEVDPSQSGQGSEVSWSLKTKIPNLETGVQNPTEIEKFPQIPKLKLLATSPAKSTVHRLQARRRLPASPPHSLTDERKLASKQQLWLPNQSSMSSASAALCVKARTIAASFAPVLPSTLRLSCYSPVSVQSMEISNESIEGLKIEYVDISPLPFLNTDLEVDGTFPPVVEEFRQKILKADSVLFASPEYNYSVTGPLKNAIDWASRPPNVWADKAAAIISAGGGFGGGRSQYHLRQIGVYLDLHFINKPEFFLNAFQPPSKFNSDGDLIDADTKEKIKAVLLALQAFTLRLQGHLVMGFDSDLEMLIDSAGQAPSRGQTTKGLKVVLKRKSTTSSRDQHTVGQSPVGSCPSGSSATPSQTKSIGKRPVEAVEVETSGDAHAIDPKRARSARGESRLDQTLTHSTISLPEMFNLLFQMSPPTASLVNETTDNVAKHIAHHLSQVLALVASTSTELFVRARRDVIKCEEELRKLKERVRDLEAQLPFCRSAASSVAVRDEWKVRGMEVESLETGSLELLERVTAWGYHREKHAMEEFLYQTLEDALPEDWEQVRAVLPAKIAPPGPEPFSDHPTSPTGSFTVASRNQDQ
nr:NADPH:quinone oxidoreductase [Ipomoea batatas]